MNKAAFCKQVGKNLKRIRRAQGIKQSKLADGVGVIVSTISKIERGLYMPPLKMFADICGYINANPYEVLYRDADWLEWEEESAASTDHSLIDLIDVMNIVENEWAKADLCKERNDKKGEEFHLDTIIQMCLKGQGLDFYTQKVIPNLVECKDMVGALRELANSAYKDLLNNELRKISKDIRRAKINNIKLTESQRNN